MNVELGTQWSTAERLLTWVRPECQEQNRQMLEEFRANSAQTAHFQNKLAIAAAKKAKRVTARAQKTQDNKQSSSKKVAATVTRRSKRLLVAEQN